MKKKAGIVRLLILDVDGVLTDGKIYYSDQGMEEKAFDVKDGVGIKLLLQEGIKVAIISGRKSKAVEHRAKDLGIDEVYLGINDKVAAFEEILKKNKINPEEVGFVGDDVVDLPLLSRVGFAIGVSDGVKEVKKVAHYVTKSPGGKGAVREVCELILKSQKKWGNSLARLMEK